MNRDKQIEEMVKTLSKCECECPRCKACYSWELSENLYNEGYRKSTDLAREIFEEIENAHDECIHIDPTTNIGYLLKTKFLNKLAELKKKYTEDEG